MCRKGGAVNWIAYQVMPIDFRWDHLSTFSEVLAQCQQRDTRALIDPGAHPFRVTSDALREAFDHAQTAARSAGWDGDFRHEAVVFWIPCNEEFKFGFVWK